MRTTFLLVLVRQSPRRRSGAYVFRHRRRCGRRGLTGPVRSSRLPSAPCVGRRRGRPRVGPESARWSSLAHAACKDALSRIWFPAIPARAKTVCIERVDACQVGEVAALEWVRKNTPLRHWLKDCSTARSAKAGHSSDRCWRQNRKQKQKRPVQSGVAVFRSPRTRGGVDKRLAPILVADVWRCDVLRRTRRQCEASRLAAV
jgi:hypothetical protein